MKRRTMLLGIISIAGCTGLSDQSETVWYVMARVVDDEPEEAKITEYSDERVQSNEFARELIPKAVRSGGYAEKKAPDAGKNAINDLPTEYISYEHQVVRMLLRNEE